jgi:hypothetical protein
MCYEPFCAFYKLHEIVAEQILVDKLWVWLQKERR